ncbi:contact-dependent growth inhibition system immunity protein [Klebsiella aerogenes]|uniref:contact-dependent growth inhibition system immunity protein n=1 Tax=Klebsiella aerogenes TaxID=548 RepID=UPI001D0F0B02|nr:contact-dependent growth inhibition system immunity protein [Klebsiella aerogenes]
MISRAIYLNRENIKSLLGASKSSGCVTINYPAGQDIDTFIESYSDRLDDEFKSRYGYDFSPELWETTIYEFLTTVRRLALI